MTLAVELGAMAAGIVLLALGVRAERRQRGYISSAEPITRLPRVRPGPGPGGRRPS